MSIKNWIDGKSVIKPEQGWVKKPVPYETISIEVGISVEAEYKPPLEYIKKSLMGKIIEEIFEKDLVEIQKEPQLDPYGTETYRAKLRIPNQKTSTVVMDPEHFIWQGKRWTQDELIKALEKAYPQYMI